MGMNGWISPREPTTSMTMDSGGTGGVVGGPEAQAALGAPVGGRAARRLRDQAERPRSRRTVAARRRPWPRRRRRKATPAASRKPRSLIMAVFRVLRGGAYWLCRDLNYDRSSRPVKSDLLRSSGGTQTSHPCRRRVASARPRLREALPPPYPWRATPSTAPPGVSPSRARRSPGTDPERRGREHARLARRGRCGQVDADVDRHHLVINLKAATAELRGACRHSVGLPEGF